MARLDDIRARFRGQRPALVSEPDGPDVLPTVVLHPSFTEAVANAIVHMEGVSARGLMVTTDRKISGLVWAKASGMAVLSGKLIRWQETARTLQLDCGGTLLVRTIHEHPLLGQDFTACWFPLLAESPLIEEARMRAVVTNTPIHWYREDER